jgi:serine/threonine protein kinase/tetratricopeptide (TPR) repeat protein
MDRKIDADGTFSASPGHDRREESGPLELAYLNLVKLKRGTVINERYRLEKLIGQGGFGIVFEALDVTLNSRVAVKFLNPKLTGNEKKFLRVQREINLSRKISDERIIKVFSLEKWQEIYFLVMELVAGSSLKAFLQEKGRRAWPELKEIFLEILDAVDVLHGNGIVHRDLKPANILITGDRKIKVLDFGLAKELTDMDKTSTIGEIVGSPYYMSPEQIRGEAVDFRSDVYQLGLILYRALSGRHPFEHPSTMEVIFKQLNQQPEPLSAGEEAIPRFLRFGLEKALEKTPSRRFSDAGAMARFFRSETMSWQGGMFSAVQRKPVKWGLAGLALAILGFMAYQATFGSRTVHSLRNDGSRLEAYNRFGVKLWEDDFAPFAIFDSFRTNSAGPVSKGTGIASQYQKLDLGAGQVIVSLLTPPAEPVFPPGDSISSGAHFCQRVILDQDGVVLKREPFLAEYEYDSYDYIRVIKPHDIQWLGKDRRGEMQGLLTVQQYQSMYPSAMVYMRGLKKYVFTHPGTFDVTPLASSDDKASFMLFGINNLFSHMSFVAEIGFSVAGANDQLIRGIPNFNPDGRRNILFEEKLFILPFRSRLIENRWREEGRARFSELSRGDIVEIDRYGQMILHTSDGIVSCRDSQDVLRRVYRLFNSSFQEKLIKQNPQNALALIVEANSYPLQNPYLRSALLFEQGDLEIGLGRYTDGEKTLQQALAVFAGNNDACERLCEMEMLRGDAQAALQRLADTRSDGNEFWGFSSFGVQLFKGYLFMHSGMFSQAEAEFERIRQKVPEIKELCQATGDLFKGNYTAALAAARDLEKWPLGAVDLRELRLLLGRALLLADTDIARAKFLFDDIFRNSLEFGHLAELSTWYLLAREGRGAEARQNAREAFTHLQARARGDFMTRLWLFYDAYVFGRTMDLVGDRAEAARGYRACIEANPHAELAARSRQSLERLQRRR